MLLAAAAYPAVVAHPLPGRIRTLGPLPVSFDPIARDAALSRFRARVDAAIARNETVIVVGDFNVAPTEPAYGSLVGGLRLAAVALAGCGSDIDPSPRAIDGVFPPIAELPPLPFQLTDQTGLIRALAVADPDGLREGVSSAALHATW